MTEVSDFSPIDANNTSITGESLEGNVANMGRMEDTLQAIIGSFGRWTNKGSIASATTTDIGAQPEAYLTVSGTTTITGLGTIREGTIRLLKFDGILTLTHNATSLILPGGANITTAAGDTAIFVSEGSGNWRCIDYVYAVARPSGALLVDSVATTSGTSFDFTSIPTWATEITINFQTVSTGGVNYPQILLGTASSFETTGYSACSSTIPVSGSVATTAYTNLFGIRVTSASMSLSGSVTFRRADLTDDLWIASGTLFDTGNVSTITVGGAKSLSGGALTRIRLTTNGGTDAFDAGAVNITYRG